MTLEFKCLGRTGKTDLSCRLISNCAGEASPSTGVLRYSSMAKYGSDWCSTALDMILFAVCTVFLLNPFDCG